jgi:hypothetical protein
VRRMRRTICLFAAAAATAALSTTALLPGRAAAVGTVGHSDLTTTVQVVATGLNVPKGLVYDREHQRLLIAEAGVAAGNTGPCAPGGGIFSGGTMCYGATGSVYSFSLAPNGWSGRIVTGLPSVSDSGHQFVFGLHGLSVFGGRLRGVFGLFGTTATRTGLGPGAADLGQVVEFGKSGQVTPIADVAALEAQINGAQAQSNPFGIATGEFGTLIANEGVPAVGNVGGDDLLRLKNGTLTQLVAFPPRAPAADPNATVDPVPSCVVQGPDGAFYVGELTSFPTTFVGEARVWRVVPGQAPTVFASGFTTIADIAFDSRGRLLVAQLGPQTAFIRVNKDGTRTLLASTQLEDPGGIAVINDHTFYLTNGSGGIGGDGELLKITVSGDD